MLLPMKAARAAMTCNQPDSGVMVVAGINKKLGVLCVIIIAILSLGYYLSPVDEDKGPSTVTVIIRFNDSGKLYKGNITEWKEGRLEGSQPSGDNTTTFEFHSVQGENQTVFSVLRIAAEWGNFTIGYRDFNTPKGVFVESIAGVENGEYHWQYYLNDVYGVRGSDSKAVGDGDIVIWAHE